MAGHAEDSLRRACIAQVLDLAFAVPTSEAVGAECLVACENSEILDFIATVVAAICTIVANEGAIAEEEEVRIGVEEGTAGVAAEAVYVPSVASCDLSVSICWEGDGVFL